MNAKEFVLIEKDGMFLKTFASVDSLIDYKAEWTHERKNALTVDLDDVHKKTDKIDYLKGVAGLVGGQVILYNTVVGLTDIYGRIIKLGQMFKEAGGDDED